MGKPVVFVARPIPECGIEALRGHAEVRLHDSAVPPSREQLMEGVSGCAGILSLLSDRIDADVMQAAGDQLKVISNFAVGYNNIDVAEAQRRSIAVGNTPDVLTDATADMAVTLTLAVARRLREGWQAVEQGHWKTWEPLGWLGMELREKTLGIVGMGRIGAAVARRLHFGWGMRVLYTARSKKPVQSIGLDAAHVSLDELLHESDVVSLHVPLTSETKNLIGAPELSRLKRTCILINTARGEVIDQAALIDTLQQGRIFGAGLDVCTPEPLPTDSPLLQVANCIVAPHIASATVATRNAMADRAAANIIAGITGEPLPFAV